jgi:hypothetical protein
MNRTTALVATILLALLSLTVGAQVYRWVDKDGKVQYSDQPPPPGAGKADVTKINSSTPSAASTTGAPPKAPEKGKTPEKSKVESANAVKPEEEARQKRETEEYCQGAKGELRQLQDGDRLAVTAPNGERRFIEDDERATRIQNLQKKIAEVCK